MLEFVIFRLVGAAFGCLLPLVGQEEDVFGPIGLAELVQVPFGRIQGRAQIGIMAIGLDRSDGADGLGLVVLRADRDRDQALDPSVDQLDDEAVAGDEYGASTRPRRSPRASIWKQAKRFIMLQPCRPLTRGQSPWAASTAMRSPLTISRRAKQRSSMTDAATMSSFISASTTC